MITRLQLRAGLECGPEETARRSPAASIPAKHRKALEEAVKSDSTLELDGIAICPPGR